MYSISEINSIVEKTLFSLELKGEPQKLYSPIEYLVSIGGKRIRPKLVLTTFNLFSDKIDRSVVYPAIGLEIFHGFTLIHDDIMDKADLRRNMLTVHKKWNDNIAILSGDVMCIKSYQYIAMAPEDKLKSVLELFSETAVKVCEGQQYDMNFEASPFITMDDYISMIGLKTAVLIAASAKLGAVIAGAPHKVADALYDYGYNMGLAFQIKDDYLDSFGNTSMFGKKIGGDILCGKKTWLLVEALKRADSGSASELNELLDRKVSSEEQERSKIDSVIAIYRRLEIDKAATEAMDLYNKEALECLERANLKDKQKERMVKFAAALLKREK